MWVSKIIQFGIIEQCLEIIPFTPKENRLHNPMFNRTEVFDVDLFLTPFLNVMKHFILKRNIDKL